MRFVAKTLYGLENVLEKELTGIGAGSVKAVNRAVLFEGDKKLLYKSNYCLRSALSILLPVAEFRIKSKDDLYRGGLKVKWDRYLNADDTISVVPVVNSPVFTHSGYPGLILKDAVADYFRNKTGKRPSVNSSDPDIVINLHISNDIVSVSLDSTVIPLYKRGYRKEQHEASLNEVLAAGILLISGWNGTQDFIDPMCGSGTFPVEAGLIASGIQPGSFRKHFGFMRWKDYDRDIFEEIRSEAAKMISRPDVKISASDISEKAIRMAETNISEAGLTDFISTRVSDFKDLKRDENNYIIFMNPPYGLRLQPEEIDGLYGMIGTTLKHNFAGSTAWLITPNKEALKHVGLKYSAKHILFNGALECTLSRFDLYQGTRKHSETTQKSV